MLSDFTTVVNALALKLNLGPQEESDCYAWEFDGRKVNITYSEMQDALVLDCLVKQVPADMRYYALIEILLGSFLFSETAGTQLSLYPDNCVNIHVSWPMRRLQAGVIDSLLENFLNVADYWEKRLSDMKAEPEENETHEDFLMLLNYRV